MATKARTAPRGRTQRGTRVKASAPKNAAASVASATTKLARKASNAIANADRKTTKRVLAAASTLAAIVVTAGLVRGTRNKKKHKLFG